MAELDRDSFIAMLERLGAADDEDALRAAREVHAAVTANGLSWNDLLYPVEPPVEVAPVAEHYEPGDADDAVASANGHGETAEAAAAAILAPPPAALAEDAKIIDRLLTRKNLSRDLRDELDELKRDIHEGQFAKMDSDYIRALARRLNA